MSGFVFAHLPWNQHGLLLGTAKGQAGKPWTSGLGMDLCLAAIKHACYGSTSSTAKG